MISYLENKKQVQIKAFKPKYTLLASANNTIIGLKAAVTHLNIFLWLNFYMNQDIFCTKLTFGNVHPLCEYQCHGLLSYLSLFFLCQNKFRTPSLFP